MYVISGADPGFGKLGGGGGESKISSEASYIYKRSDYTSAVGAGGGGGGGAVSDFEHIWADLRRIINICKCKFWKEHFFENVWK